MDMVLIAGLWLTGSAWDDVVPPLEELGHRPVPVTLPGQGDGSSSATLDDQVAAVVAAVDAAVGPVVVVGHSAACTLAWLAADARPEKVASVVLIGGFPSADGETYAPVADFSGWQFLGGIAPDQGKPVVAGGALSWDTTEGDGWVTIYRDHDDANPLPLEGWFEAQFTPPGEHGRLTVFTGPLILSPDTAVDGVG